MFAPRFVLIALTVIVVGLFIYEQTTLRALPVADSMQYWYGDETWLMADYRSQVETGVLRYPEAVSSIAEYGNGVLFGNMWLTSLLYGLPYSLHGSDGVIVGRSVTAILAALLLYFLYRFSIKSGASQEASIASVIILMLSESFLLSSHSARADLFIGLTVLVYSAYLIETIKRRQTLSQRDWIVLGAVAPLGILVSPHVLLSVLPGYLGVLILCGVLKHPRRLLAVAGGAAVMLLAILGLYALTNAEWTLLGRRPIDSNSTLVTIRGYFPLTNIWTPRSVFAFVVTRLQSLWRYAPMICVWAAIVLSFGIYTLLKTRRRWSGTRWELRCVVLLIGLGYVMMEAVHLRSIIYFLPTLVLLLTVETSAQLCKIKSGYSATIMGVAVIACIIIYIPRFTSEAAVAAKISSSSRSGYASALSHVPLGARIVGNVPCAGFLIDDPAVHFMANFFTSYPTTRDSLAAILLQNRVEYAMIVAPYHWDPSDLFFEVPLWNFLANRAELMYIGTGAFVDYRLSSDPSKRERDTVRIYRIRQQS